MNLNLRQLEVKIVSDLYTLNNSSNSPIEFVAEASNLAVHHILNHTLTGVVHSTFTNSFNIIFAGKIIHIGATDKGIAPFGIGLSGIDAQRLTKKVSIGEPVKWEKDSQKITFHHGLSLSLQKIILSNHSLHKSAYNATILQDNLTLIGNTLLQKNWQTGLVQTDDEKKEMIHSLVFETDFNPNYPALLEIERMLLFARSGEVTHIDAASIFNYWIGRGPGLTPSGDDLTTGVCAMLSLLDGAHTDFLETLKIYLSTHGEKRTTQVSLEYLTYAANNEYHSHLVELSKLLLKRESPELLVALEKVRKLGHTSGTDTLIGVLLGIRAVITN